MLPIKLLRNDIQYNSRQSYTLFYFSTNKRSDKNITKTTITYLHDQNIGNQKLFIFI